MAVQVDARGVSSFFLGAEYPTRQLGEVSALPSEWGMRYTSDLGTRSVRIENWIYCLDCLEVRSHDARIDDGPVMLGEGDRRSLFRAIDNP